MIEEYLNQRLEILTKQKNELKDQLISIRSSISTAKLHLDDYVSSNTRPFEPFYPRKDFKYDDELASLNKTVSDLSSQFEQVNKTLNGVETELSQVNQCISEYQKLK
jgi:prefoldin subunit 5